jgi:hypothetical protein
VYAPPHSGALYSKLSKLNNTMYVTGTTGLNVYSYPGGTFQYAVSNQMGEVGAVDPAPAPISERRGGARISRRPVAAALVTRA